MVKVEVEIIYKTLPTALASRKYDKHSDTREHNSLTIYCTNNVSDKQGVLPHKNTIVLSVTITS